MGSPKMIESTLRISSLLLLLAGMTPAASLATGEGTSQLPNLRVVPSDVEPAMNVFRQYWSEDGHWVTEGLAGNDQICVIVYEAKDGVLKEISREIKARPAVELPRVRGPNPMKEVFDQWAPAVARIERPGCLGSGIILTSDGLILTNRHVVLNAANVFVYFYKVTDQAGKLKGFPGEVIAADKVRDLALIKVEDPPSGLKAFTLQDRAKVDPGVPLFAIGHPLGEDWTPTQGVASAMRPDYDWDYCFTRNKADVIQFQTPMSQGNSGGPLLDEQGNVVGITSFGRAEGQNVNFAICVNEMKDFVDNRSWYSATDVHDWQPVSFERRVELERRGINNAQQCDFENDGVIDIIRLDTDNNGDWDHMIMDVNHDSAFEFMALDLNEDGYYEALFLDSRGDGTFDYVFKDDPPIKIPVSVQYLGHPR